MRHAEVAEWLDPLPEDRRCRRVALSVDAADRAGAVVDIEIDLQLAMVPRQGLNLPAWIAHDRRAAHAAEMLRHVEPRADQPLLLAIPQAHAHGSLQR